MNFSQADAACQAEGATLVNFKQLGDAQQVNPPTDGVSIVTPDRSIHTSLILVTGLQALQEEQFLPSNFFSHNLTVDCTRTDTSHVFIVFYCFIFFVSSMSLAVATVLSMLSCFSHPTRFSVQLTLC